MRLIELNNPKLTKLIAIIDTLDNAVQSGEIKTNWTIDMLSEYFRLFDIILSPTDFYNMIQKKPLNKVIKNIEGDTVLFRGLSSDNKKQEMPSPEKNKEVVAKMAKKALSR